jgi:hypothetical protein
MLRLARKFEVPGERDVLVLSMVKMLVSSLLSDFSTKWMYALACRPELAEGFLRWGRDSFTDWQRVV